jgi:type I restriction enzyme S subunit
VPELRFPEFSGEWEEKKLGDISSDGMYGMNAAAIDFDGENKYIRITDISENSNNFVPKPLCSPNGNLEDKFLLKENDLLFARTGASTGKSYLYNKEDGKLYFAGFLIKFHVNKANSKFVFYNTLRSKYENWVRIMSIRSGQPGINAEEYKKLEINLPSIPEQEKIASFLSKVDEKIEKLEKKQELWETYKKGMMQKIFSQELRFKDENGEDYPDWKIGKIEDVIIQKIRKIQKPNDGYWRLGLRSHAKGTFHEFVEDPSKIAMDYLFLVKENDLILNITFAWEHAIALASKEDEDKLVSHRFPTYSFYDNAKPLFYKYYFLQSKFKFELENISPGGAGRNRVMRKNEFLKLEVPIPDLLEQEKIVNTLFTTDEKINQLNTELNLNKEFKKGLLQQMFC